jgi:NlpC/P60 family putative phage cell wall peptidase
VAPSADIVTEARTWLGTPFHHAAALRGVGCDCVGIVIGIARALGCLPADYRAPTYSPQWHLHRYEELLRTAMEQLGCRPVPLAARQPGHILLFRYGRVASHSGILVARDPDFLVHAVLHKGVLYQRLAGDLLARLRACYTFPEVVP